MVIFFDNGIAASWFSFEKVKSPVAYVAIFFILCALFFLDSIVALIQQMKLSPESRSSGVMAGAITGIVILALLILAPLLYFVVGSIVAVVDGLGRSRVNAKASKATIVGDKYGDFSTADQKRNDGKALKSKPLEDSEQKPDGSVVTSSNDVLQQPLRKEDQRERDDHPPLSECLAISAGTPGTIVVRL